MNEYRSKSYNYKDQVLSEVAQSIKTLRTEKGLTQKELAKKAGVSREDVSRIETLSKYPNLEMIKKLAAAMDLAVTIEFTRREDKDMDISENAWEIDKLCG